MIRKNSPSVRHSTKNASAAFSWKRTVAQSLMAIVGLGSAAVAQAQEGQVDFEVSYGTSAAAPDAKLCNDSYVRRGNRMYINTALHCETGQTGKAAVNRNDITYRKIPTTHVRDSVAKVLDYAYFAPGSLDQKTVTAHIRVYNLDGEIGKNRYQFEVTGTAHYDAERDMYFVRIPQETLRQYSEKVGDFAKHRMKSASGSPVEYRGKHIGTLSGIKFNPYYHEIQGLKPFEARMYIAPAKSERTI